MIQSIITTLNQHGRSLSRRGVRYDGPVSSALVKAQAKNRSPRAHRLQEGNVVYHQLLRAELLGVPPVPPSPEKPSLGGSGDARAASSPMTSPVKKMFRYKSGDRC